MKPLINPVYVFWLILTSINCTNQLTGGGTETTNGISGTVSCFSNIPFDHNGIIAAIYSVDYRPDSAIGVAETTIVGTDGDFEFTPPDDKWYNLFVWDTVKSMAVYLPQLPSDTMLGAILLKDAGVLKTTKPSPATGESPYAQFKLLIPGTPFHFGGGTGKSDSTFLLPQGEYRIEFRLLPKDALGDNPVWVNQQKYVVVDPALEDTVWLVIP
jgi:hypothetical protein